MDEEISDQQLTIQIARPCGDLSLSSDSIEKLVNTICRRFGLSKAIISIAVVNDEDIRRLNKQFLKRDNITDVLSFDLSDEKNKDQRSLEIVVNAQLAARRQPQSSRSAVAELALYITHGLLHQLGFDDAQTGPAKIMHQTEEQILQQLGYDFVYE